MHQRIRVASNLRAPKPELLLVVAIVASRSSNTQLCLLVEFGCKRQPRAPSWDLVLGHPPPLSYPVSSTTSVLVHAFVTVLLLLLCTYMEPMWPEEDGW